MSDQQPVYIRMSISSPEDDNKVFFSNEDDDTQPIEIIPGNLQIFAKVDELLPSMKVGDRNSLNLSKEDAFGDVVQNEIQKIPLDRLPEELRKPGEKVAAQSENNAPIQGTIISIDDESATIDFNHELAGKPIVVDFVIVEKP